MKVHGYQQAIVVSNHVLGFLYLFIFIISRRLSIFKPLNTFHIRKKLTALLNFYFELIGRCALNHGGFVFPELLSNYLNRFALNTNKYSFNCRWARNNPSII